jgi:hypothetical protein
MNHYKYGSSSGTFYQIAIKNTDLKELKEFKVSW